MLFARLIPLLGSALLSRRFRGLAGRHAGVLAIGALAYEVWKWSRSRRDGDDAQPANPAKDGAARPAAAASGRRRRARRSRP